MSSEPDPRTVYEWWFANHEHHVTWEDMHKAYRKAHPPKVTAEDVRDELLDRSISAVSVLPTTPTLAGYSEARIYQALRIACYDIAAHRNAAREDDEGWIEEAAKQIADDLFKDTREHLNEGLAAERIRTAYRGRKK